jgi:hypothetical protein
MDIRKQCIVGLVTPVPQELEVKGYLIRTTWQWAHFSTLHVAYFYAKDSIDLLARLHKIRSGLYWKIAPVKVGSGMQGSAIIFTDYYVYEVRT